MNENKAVRRLTILVVEDDQDSRDVLCLLLSSWGHAVLTAKNREEALTVLERTQPDLLLLDWYMAGMTAEDFLKELRAREKSPQVVLISAGSGLVEKATRLGIPYFLAKPIDPQVVQSCLKRWFRLTVPTSN